jgi:superfamily II DNA/RNA helicase
LKFTDFNLHPSLMDGLNAMSFKEPTPIQTQTIPLIMDGHDVLGCAQTGTGKTAAFLLPILHSLTVKPSEKIATLIIVPTRELAVQIDQQLEGFSYFTPISAIAVYGGRDGQSLDLEKKALKGGAPIVVATPGRLIAHIDMGYVNFDSLRYLVLDEADRMLDMGFAPDIMKIVNMLPKNRQTLLFSATMPAPIRKFSQQLLNKPKEVSISISKPADKIVQSMYGVEDEQKPALAEQILSGLKEMEKILIFAGTKIKVRQVSDRLLKAGFDVAAIHSDLDQAEREDRLSAFRNGKLKIVVATDVLSRGIDIKGIDLVINYDVPGDPEDYVHRIGRTGRAEAEGMAITFVNYRDRPKIYAIEKMMGREIPIANKGASSANPTSDNRPDRSDQRKKSYPPKHKQSYEKKKKSE